VRPCLRGMYEAPFTVDKGRAALAALLSAFESPHHHQRIVAARQEAGNSMIRYQQVVFPLCTEIQLGVIAQFGFKPDGEGIIQFTQHIKLMEREDQEVARLAQLVKNYFIPPMANPPMSGGSLRHQ